MRTLLLYLIRLYQKTLSPDHGWFKHTHPYGYCRFHPTCSMYAHDAIRVHGAIRGVWLGFRRVIRCHPWSQGGIDPVPEKLIK